jgi:hypothetical protein
MGGSATYGPQSRFVNKVLLEHGHAHCLGAISWLLQQRWVGATESLKPSCSRSLKYLLSHVLRKSLLIYGHIYKYM